jgi:hypothetical protein
VIRKIDLSNNHLGVVAMEGLKVLLEASSTLNLLELEM